jgi:hypothetical protein
MQEPQINTDKTDESAASEATELSGARTIPTGQPETELDWQARERLAEQPTAPAAPNVETADEPGVIVCMSKRDFEAVAIIKSIVSERMQDEPYWGDVVLDVLTSYCDRGKQLKDWWIYAHFLATFGGLERGVEQTITSSWRALDTLDELCKAWKALSGFEGFGWLKRLRLRKVKRQAYLDLLNLLGTLTANQQQWNDWHQWLRYRGRLGH